MHEFMVDRFAYLPIDEDTEEELLGINEIEKFYNACQAAIRERRLVPIVEETEEENIEEDCLLSV